MVGLYVFAGIAIFFWILLSISTGVRVIYNSAAPEDAHIYAKIGFYRIDIIAPEAVKSKKGRKGRGLFGRRKTKVKKAVDRKFKQKKKVRKKTEEKAQKEPPKYSAREIIAFSKEIGLISLKKLRKYLRFEIYKAEIKVGAEDAYKTAMLYANINRAAYYIYELLNNNFKFRLRNPRNVAISPDFLSGKVNFDIDLKISMRVGAGLSIFTAMAMSFVKFWAKSRALKAAETEKENKNNIKNDAKKGRVAVNG